ncbi:MAG: ATP-binding protein [Bacteroidia bacterium]|nr:ATP-binding protein [Bacteroidia bacterium]
MPSSVKRKLCLYLLLLCNSIFLNAQGPDSLNKELENHLLIQLKNTDSDSERLKVYLDLVQLVRYKDANKMIDYSNQGLLVARRIDEASSIAYLSFMNGTGKFLKGKHQAAIEAFDRSLAAGEALKDTTYAFALNGMGNAFESMGDSYHAILNYEKVIRLGDSLQNPLIATLGLGNISSVYIRNKDFKDAKPYLIKALKLAEKNNISRIKAFAYTDLGVVYKEEMAYDSAIHYLRKSVILSTKKQLFPYIGASAYNGLAQIYFAQKDNKKSLQASSQAIKLAEESKNQMILASAYLTKMLTLKDENKFDQAVQLGFQIRELAKNAHIFEEELEALQQLAEIYYAKEDYKQAYKYQKLHSLRKSEFETKREIRNDLIEKLREELKKQKEENRASLAKVNEVQDFFSRNKVLGFGMMTFSLILLLVLIVLYKRVRDKETDRILSFSKLERDQVNMYKKQLFTLIFIFYPPIIIHQYIWSGPLPAIIHGTLLCLIIFIRFSHSKGIEFPMYWLSVCFYFSIALLPLYLGPIDTAFASIVAVFLNAYYQAENSRQRLLNYVLFPLTYGVYSLLSKVQPNPLTEDVFGYSLLVGFISICAIFLVVIYINKGTLDFKQALWKSNDFLRQITDLNPHYIFAKDEEGKFTLANRAMAQNMGRSSEELIGKYDEHIFYTEENRQSYEDDISVLKEGKTIDRKEELLVNAKGERRYFQTIKKPIYNENWEITGMLGVATDITDLKVAERERIQREATLNAIISSIPDPIFVIDANMKPIIFNKEFYNMADIGSIAYKEEIMDYLQRTLPREFSRKYAGVIQDVLSGNSYSGFDLLDSQFGEVHYEISGTPVRDKHNKIIGAIMLGLNVTEKNKQRQLINRQIIDLNQKNEELEKYIESNMSLENFAYLASHDLKAPLRTIISFSQLFEKRVRAKLKPQETELLNFVIGASKNMERLINDLLEYSRVNTKKLDPRPLVVKPLIREVINELSSTIQEKKARFQLKNIPEVIIADSPKFRRLLQNLITNALKFSKPDKAPRIMISVTEEEKAWIFMVKDNGIGINDKYKSKIFMLFQRLHGDTDYEGTGIGLAMVKKIVEQHQGKIWVESTQGKGSKFFFSIPKDLHEKKDIEE